MKYSNPETSFSPFFSTVGLGFGDVPGIGALYLHHNRLTTTFGRPFLRAPGSLQSSEHTAVGVRQQLDHGTVAIAFFERNAWIVQCEGVAELRFGWQELAIAEQHTGQYFPFETQGLGRWLNVPIEKPDHGAGERQRSLRAFGAYVPTPDLRDPDRFFALGFGLRSVRGTLVDDETSGLLRVLPDQDGVIVLACALNILDLGWTALRDVLARAPTDLAKALTRTQDWYAETIADLEVKSHDPREAGALTAAAHTLVHNMHSAPGLLAGRVAVYPNRGAYATHFLWDACFQTLALARMRAGLAADSLLLLSENTRFDGKMPQFVCPTWVRPHESQPPLVGWAGLELVRRSGDLELARRLLPVLLRNTAWWLAQRMTAYGLIGTYSGFETGWDNTPRFDRGPIIACDMNSYVLVQMRCCEALARLLGDTATAEATAQQADAWGRRLVDVLYDHAAGRFTERLIESGERLSLQTPALFLPLWAGVPIADRDAQHMIRHDLLDPKRFFGQFPFPCVAYNEPGYAADDWWRGPVWLPIAYLMLETLTRYGFHVERDAAAQRLYRMVLEDGHMSELFNSHTGQGLGSRQLGWTAAIFLRLHQELTAGGKHVSRV